MIQLAQKFLIAALEVAHYIEVQNLLIFRVHFESMAPRFVGIAPESEGMTRRHEQSA